MIARDDIVEVLMDGTKAQMDEIRCSECGGPISYTYSSGCEAFTVSCKCTEERCHGVFHEPNCVKYFSNEHTF